MREEYKKQHIVPKAYLNKFASKENGKNIIGVHYKDKKGNEKHFLKSTDDIGFLNNYYDTDRSPNKKWEHYLDKKFDVLCGEKLNDIIKKLSYAKPNTDVITDEIKDILTKIVYSLMVRNPEFIEYNILQSKIHFKDVEKLFLEEEGYSEKKKYDIQNIETSENDMKDMTLESVFLYLEKICTGCLSRRTWVVYQNSNYEKIPFVTSDNPVMLYNVRNGKLGWSDNNIANNDTDVFLPLSPSILLALYPIQMGFENKKIYFNDDQFAIRMNERTIRNCFEHSFFPRELVNKEKADIEKLWTIM